MNIHTFFRKPPQLSAILAAGLACLCLGVGDLRSQDCVPSPSGLVAFWPGEGDGRDLAGGNAGQLIGTAVIAPGRVGLCFQFAASGDGVLIGNQASLQLQNFSIEAWIRRSSSTIATLDSTGNGAIFGFGYNGYAFGIYDDGRLLLTKVGAGGIPSTIAIKDTDWHHVALTKRGGDVVFYIDGVREGPQLYDPGFGFGSNAMIGGVALESVRASFLGSIDEVSVYNRDLTASEVQSIFDAGTFGKCRPPAVVISPASGVFQDSSTVTMSANTTNGVIRYTLDASVPSAGSQIYQASLSITNTTTVEAQLFLGATAISPVAIVTLVRIDPAKDCVSTNGLVGWWPGDGTGIDVIGHHDGMLVGPTIYSAGEAGQAFNFAGNGAAVVVGNPLALQLQSFTVEAWIRRNRSDVTTASPSGNGGIFGYGVNGYAFGIYNDGRLLLSKVGAGGVNSRTGVNDLDWHHVAVTKMGSAVVFYMDGFPVGEEVYDPAFAFTSNAAIGDVGETGSGFLGSIDQLKVYDQGLDAAKILDRFNGAAFGQCSPPTITISPNGGQFTNSVSVNLTTPATNGVIRYSLEGNRLSASSPEYLGPISVTNTTTITAQLFDGEMPLSPIASATFFAAGCPPLLNDLVSWWRGNGSAADVVGRNHGILTGPVVYSEGTNGQAFNFTGAGAAVFVGNPPALQLQSFTIEAWIRRSRTDLATADGTGSGAIFGYGWNGYAFGIYNDGRLLLSRVGVSGVNSMFAVNDLNWHHVAVTKSGGSVAFYLDGVSDGEQAYDPGFAFASNAAIGAAGDRGSSYLGAIDEVKVYNQGLDPTRIRDYFYAAVFGQCSPPAVTISPSGGQFTNSIVVSLTTAATNGVIRYTLDGSRPSSDSPEYQGEITLTNSTVITAQLFAGGFPISPAVGATFFATGCLPIADSLVGWWRGEGITTDVIRRNDGFLSRPVVYAAGKIGQAFTFAGSGTAILVGNPVVLQVQSFTIEAWIRRSRNDVVTADPSGSGAIFGYGWNGYAFGLYNDGRLLLSKVGSGGVNSRAVVNDINWHHVAVAKTGGLVAFYVDGVSEGEQVYDPGFAFTSNAAIGAVGENGSDFLGSIDELSVYNRGLTQAEVVALVGAGSFGKCTDFPPRIWVQPRGQNIAAGSNAVFTVSASSTVALSYQWNFNENPISGATNDMLVISNAPAGAAGNYTVKVSNSFGSQTSNAATLIISAGPLITKQPRSQTVLVGANATFAVTASGTAPLSYEWRFNDQPISGATGPILIVNSVAIANSGGYSVLVTNSVGSVLSGSATLTVASGTLSLAPVSGEIQLNVTGEAGASYTVEVSSDLDNWSSLVSEVNVPLSWQFVDPTTDGVNQRFYRLRKK